MRRLSLAIAAVLTLSGPLASTVAHAQTGALPVTAASAELPIGQGETSYVTVGGAVRDVVVADPAVADISILNERTLLVMGKRPGVTALMVFGTGGRTLAARQVVVSEAGDSGVTVYRGVNGAGYACASRCTRVVAAAAGGAAPAPAASGTP